MNSISKECRLEAWLNCEPQKRCRAILEAMGDEEMTARQIAYKLDFFNRVKADQSVIGTLTTNIGSPTPRNGTKLIEPAQQQPRIRKLTPKECYRLMGFDDIDHDRAAQVVSNSQLYKQAGNSIVVDVLNHLLPNVLKAVRR